MGKYRKLGGTKIKDSIVDAVIRSNVLFQLEDKNIFILEVKRILKPGGKALLLTGQSRLLWARMRSSPKTKREKCLRRRVLR